MSDKAVFDPQKLTILEYKFIKGQIETPEIFEISAVESYDTEYTFQLFTNVEDKLIKADFSIELITVSKGKNKIEANGNFHLIFIFKVENMEDFTSANPNGSIDLDPFLGNAISSVTYSTSRGILLIRLQGTAFENFILPIINPNKLLQNLNKK